MIMNVIDLLEPFPPTTCHISQGNRRTSKLKPYLSMSRFNQLIKAKGSTKRHVDILWRLAHVNDEASQRYES